MSSTADGPSPTGRCSEGLADMPLLPTSLEPTEELLWSAVEVLRDFRSGDRVMKSASRICEHVAQAGGEVVPTNITPALVESEEMIGSNAISIRAAAGRAKKLQELFDCICDKGRLCLLTEKPKDG